MASGGDNRHDPRKASSLRYLVDPPALRAAAEQQRRVGEMLDPPALRALREQQDRVRTLVDGPAVLRVAEPRHVLRDAVDPPALRQLREQNARFRELATPAFVRQLREQQERIRELVNPPFLRQLREQQESLRDVLHSAPTSSPLGAGLMDLASWQENTTEQLEYASERASEESRELSADDVAAALGERSVETLVADLEILVKALEWVSAGVGLTLFVAGAAVPVGMMLIVAFAILTCELALAMAKRSMR
jgi:hypothetical protein